MTEGAKILVVEDDGIIAEDIRATLVRLGYSVPQSAQSCDEALALAAEESPSLVLMDIKLRGPVDGIEVTRRLKERWDVPVVYLTSHSDDATLTRARDTGPHGYLLKPFNERDLRTTIEVALGKHELEQRMVARERWFATTLRSIGDAVIATDTGERITFLNRVAEEITGWRLEAAVGRPITEVLQLVDSRGRPLPSPVRIALRTGFRVALPPDARLVAATGVDVDVEDAATPILDDRGALLGGVVVFRDISERRRLEERVARAERLAAIGTLASGVAHEINNPLGAVLANVEFVLGRLGTGSEEVRSALEETLVAVRRVGAIVHDLSRFGRTQPATDQVADLPAVVELSRRLTETHLVHAATLRVELGTTPFVAADEGRLSQVLTNLLLNAAQAIGEGDAANHSIHVRTRTDAAGRAVLEVEDTGPGIQEQDLRRIFDPFFTTKPVGKGTGLGLAIAHEIVTGLGGDITVESPPGRGARFVVALPPAPRPPERSARAPARSPSVAGLRILVIDDDQILLRAMARMLQDCAVVACTDAREALARIAGGAEFDVILCDVMMPNMTGMDFHAALAAAAPEVANRIVFMTGGVFSHTADVFLAATKNPTIGKPFTSESVREALRAVLDPQGWSSDSVLRN